MHEARSLRRLAVGCIILGAFNLVYKVMTWLYHSFSPRRDPSSFVPFGPFLVLRSYPQVLSWELIATSTLFVIAGLGLLRRRLWAARLLEAVACWCLAWAAFMGFCFLMWPRLEIGPLPNSFYAILSVLSVLTSVVWVIATTYVISFLHRGAVRAELCQRVSRAG